MAGRSPAAALVAEGERELADGTPAGNQRAASLFERAVEADPGSVPGLVGLANAYLELADAGGSDGTLLERAIAAGETAVQLDPADGDAYLVLAHAYRAKGALTKELELSLRRAELAPDDPRPRARAGWVLWFTGRSDEALPWLDAAASTQGDVWVHRWVHFFLGNAFLALGDFTESTQRYGRAVELYPDHSSARAGVVWSLLAAGKDEEARAALGEFQQAPSDGDRHPLKLADLEFFLGDDDVALVHATEALAEPEERYWPRGFLAGTITGALLWPLDRERAEEQLERSERIDRERLEGGDEGYMAHIDLAAVASIRGRAREACRWVGSATAAGWRGQPLAIRDRLFANVRANPEFRSLVSS